MQYPYNAAAFSQLPARPAGPPTAPPTQEYAPPLLPPAGPSWALPAPPIPGHGQPVFTGPQPAPWALQSGQVVVAGSPTWFIAPAGYLGWVSVPLLYGPIYSLGWVPPSPPAVKTPWRPPSTPRLSCPEGVDRDDEDSAGEAPNNPEVAADPLCATINHWATCASEWSAKDPSLTKIFKWEGLAQFTRLFLRQFLRPNWLHNDAVMAHVRRFFPDFSKAETIYWNMRIVPEAWGKPQKQFLCWLMADFCSVDPSLDDLVIAAGIKQARGLGCLSHFEKLLVHELGRKPADVKRLKIAAASMLADAESASSTVLNQPATHQTAG